MANENVLKFRASPQELYRSREDIIVEKLKIASAFCACIRNQLDLANGLIKEALEELETREIDRLNIGLFKK